MKNVNNFNKDQFKPRILVAPLDWGLGHATRCIPVITELTNQNCEVFIVADKHLYSLLKEEFPLAVFLRYKGYEIHYSRTKRGFLLKMLLQFPKIFTAIKREHHWLKKTVNEYKIDAIISDNRFGMYCKNIPCVYITHQLFIATGNVLTEKIAQKIHRYFIKKYTHCWVPDFKENGLAGKLSHPANIPSNVTYIGPLSRFKKLIGQRIIYDVLVAISGPEPQRTFFEKIIIDELAGFSGKVLLLRGLPGETSPLPGLKENVTVVNHLSAEALNKALEQSKIIISRSGYTSIMDYMKLQKTTILVPTPGQTEQEYLAHYLAQKKYTCTVEQKNFSLEKALMKAHESAFSYPGFSTEEYKKATNEFVLSLKTGNFAPQ